MATIVTRSGKGSALAHTEVDANFTNLNNDKLETSAAYVHPNHSGEVTSTADGATVVASNVIDADNLKVTGNGSTSQFLRSDGDGTFTWATPADTDTVYTHPNHSGEVTSTADGATVIADNVVDEANLKVSNSPTNGYFLSAQSGNTGGLTWAAAGASTTVGDVGTYAMMRDTSSTANFTPGTTKAGSALRYANTYQYGASYYGSGNVSASGTWRIMGHSGIYNGSVNSAGTATSTSLYVRIS